MSEIDDGATPVASGDVREVLGHTGDTSTYQAENAKIMSYKRIEGAPAPFLSWCLIVRNAAETLEATLKSIRERTPDAEIVIVHTGGSKDNTEEISLKYADVYELYKGPRGDWDENMSAFDDAAAARNRSFELASGKWRAWIDADDVLPGPEETTRLLKLNSRYHPSIDGNEVPDKGRDEPVDLISLIKELEDKHPNADCIWAPYLYRRDENDCAMIWQDRERIIRWNPERWRWAEAAHEVLVVKSGPLPIRVDFTGLLFLHEKKWTVDDRLYSLNRHYEIFIKQYDEGDITARRCQYLANYAKYKCPAREEEFVNAAHTYAKTALDRYRALILKGNMFADRGLAFDAREAFGAAISLKPDMPDAYIHSAIACKKFGFHADCVEALERAIKIVPGTESEVAPRDMVTRWPTYLAETYNKLGKMQLQQKMYEMAEFSMTRASELMDKVRHDPAVGKDEHEARVRYLKYHNDAMAHRTAHSIYQLATFLIKNDEPMKAVEVLKNRPWNTEDHPLLLALVEELEPVVRHARDMKAYSEFYNDDKTTGFIHNADEIMYLGKGPVRTDWAAEIIAKKNPKARILEVGCADGAIGVALMRALPGIDYTFIDINKSARDKVQERINAEPDFQGRSRVYSDLSLMDNFDGSRQRFDFVIWFEVIEHVQHPGKEIDRLMRYVKPSGQLLISTPWGSFDHGHPPDANIYGGKRDSRGHLRAYTPASAIEEVENAGYSVEELKHYGSEFTEGVDECMVFSVSNRSIYGDRVFMAAPVSLWDWNGSKIHKEGIGASEEMMVYLGEELVRKSYDVTIFLGSLEEQEVVGGVKYMPTTRLREVASEENATLIVSRAPAWGANIPFAGKKILWLQDVYYEDLTEEVAAAYSKIIVVSEWHKQLIHDVAKVPFEKMEVIYNWLYLPHFATKVERKMDHFVYASSPDRGVVPLLQLWPKIRERLPNATLSIFYGWRGCERLGYHSVASAWLEKYEPIRREFEKLRHQPGVIVMGMVNHERIAREFMAAGVWAYPSDFKETCCNNAIKARAAGAVPVCPPLAALWETAANHLMPFFTGDLKTEEGQKLFVDMCVRATMFDEDEREEMAEQARARHCTSEMYKIWEKVLDG